MRRDVLIYAAAILWSLIGHVVVVEGLGRAARNAPPAKQHILTFKVVTPPPKVEVEPAKPLEKKEKPKPPPPKPVDLTDVQLPPEVETPPPPNTNEVEPPPIKEPVRPVFGISMSSVVGEGAGSGFSVRVGNTLMKEPEKEFTKPAEVKPYAPTPLHKLTKIPRKLMECEAPPETKRRGIEGKVKLNVEVLADGSVGEVKVVQGLNPEIDALVVAALKRCRFSPAEIAGKPVVTRIPYTYSFYAED
ncbi:MAG: TonB family protein [Deltaproteobacteria bacterium]|nr:TonB family protein [Deltaproteobacteria bacterium]